LRPALGCPFCTALRPTLSQTGERAAVVALAEMQQALEGRRSRLHLHRVLKGADRLESRDWLVAPLDVTVKPGALVLLFGNAEGAASAEMQWHAVPVNETSYAYFVRVPSLKVPTAERLRYFAPFLEHAEPLLAEDAYLEFGHAPLDAVQGAVDLLPNERLRSWLASPMVPAERKGFYGLALGLASDDKQRQVNEDFLRELIVTPADDFRAGFDGVLGGYLLLAGTKGLDLIDERYLANPRSADGDVRHAMTALRFYHEYGHGISAERLNASLRLLLGRAEFASAAITDLARWHDWTALERIVTLYDRDGYPRPATPRAIVGYLTVCPEPAATAALARLRRIDPVGVAAAEDALSITTRAPEAAAPAQ
jgi:hypothetical protein